MWKKQADILTVSDQIVNKVTIIYQKYCCVTRLLHIHLFVSDSARRWQEENENIYE